MSGSDFDKDRAKAFMGEMVGILNGGALSMMISIGHRTGLFDTMANGNAVSSAELAEQTQLNERYVREWLAAMTTGGIVDYDPAAKTYALPAEHATLVTRAGGPLNIASRMQYIALMGKVEDDVVDAFTTGDGVPYSKYPDFQRLMAEESSARLDVALLSDIIPSIPDAVERLTAGCRFADIGCGSGHALILLAEAFPNSSFVGFDFSDEGLDVARSEAAQRSLSNVEFVAGDAVNIDRPGEFDIITTFDAIHDQAHPKTVLANIANALSPNGSYLCVEPKAKTALEENMHEPVAAFQYAISTMHCMSVSIAGGGEGLGTAWGTEQTTEYLTDAGFTQIEAVDIRADRTNSYFVCHMP